MMNSRIIQVEGRAEVSVAPDQATITCGLSCFSPSYAEAQAGVNQRVAQLRGIARAVGLAPEDFKTTDFRVDRTYQEDQPRRRINGYRARHTLRLVVPLEVERVNRIVSACAGSGAEPEVAVAFGVKDHEAVRSRVLTAAVENARRRAETLAAAAGVRLGDLQRIDYGALDIRLSSQSFNLDCLCDASAGPDLAPEDVCASDKVTVTWMIGVCRVRDEALS